MPNMTDQPKVSVVSPAGAGLARPLCQPLYDSEVWAAGSSTLEIRFFVNQIGSPWTYNATVGRKSEWHTNMQLSGQISPPNAMNIAGFRIEPEYGRELTNVIRLFRSAVFTWRFGNNQYLQMPISQMAQGHGVITADTGYGTQGNIPTTFYDFRVIKALWDIKPGEAFSASLSFPYVGITVAPYADMWIRVWVLGYYHKQL